MTDVFISYSRKDKFFVQVLNQALIGSKYDAWVDWDNIPLTADWWEEIKAGIEAADKFIFVITPASIASKVCRQEVDHAVAHNKWLVPIVRQEGFDRTLVHPALGKANWLFFKEEDDFDTAFRTLVETLNTDLDHVKKHTQLLIKALEWQHKEHNPDLLLRGSQLEEFVGWITISADQEPRLTQEQREYVAASSKAEKDAQRAEIIRQQAEIERQKKARRTITIALVGASLGFIVATVLGLVAVKQRQAAQEREFSAKLIAQSYEIDSLFNAGLQIDALKEGIRGYQEIQANPRFLDAGQKLRLISSLQNVLHNIYEENRLEGHSNGVSHVSFSPDGQTLASASADGTIKLWNSKGEELITLESHSDWVTSVSFSPNGQILASASEDGTIKLWNLKGELLNTLRGHSSGVWSVRFSPNGQNLVSAGEDSTFKLWNFKGELLNTFEGHRNAVTHVSFSSDGQIVASASEDRTVKLWNLRGEVLNTLEGHNGSVESVGFSPDSQTLASASADGTIKLWDLQGKLLNTFTGHSSTIYHVSFSHDGQMLASASGDGTIKLRNLEGELLKTLEGHGDAVTHISFSPDDQVLASASGDGTVRLWNIAEEAINTFEDISGWATSVSFSPDGQTLASASQDGTVKLWNLSGKLLATLEGHSSHISHIRFSPDGHTLASASKDGTVRLWTSQGKELNVLRGHRNWVNCLSFSPDGQYLVSASADGTIKLWNLEGQELKTFEGHSAWVTSVKFSPDGQTLASTSGDLTIKLWNLKGQELKTFEGHSAWVTSVSFSPDGQTLASASGDGTIKLWNLEGELLNTLEGHSSFVSHVSFSPDGQYLVSASGDGTIKLWNLEGETLNTLKGHSVTVFDLGFSPDGQTLASASGDGTIKLWSLDAEYLVDKSCSWLNDYLITHPQILVELPACQTTERLQAAAPHLVQQAVQIAAMGEPLVVEQQLSTALNWEPHIDLDPTTLEMEQDPAQTALKLTALHYRLKGQRLAEKLNITEGIQAFEKGLSLDPALDLNPNTEEIEQDPEKVAHTFSASGNLLRGKQQVRNGEVEAAIRSYLTAQDLNPNLEITDQDWSTLCWFGSLHQQADKVMFACEREVALKPEAESSLDSRGILDALNGDFEGAIVNLQDYVDWVQLEERQVQGQVWINALIAGENPFTLSAQ